MKKHRLPKKVLITVLCLILSAFMIVGCKPGADKLPVSDKDNGGLILPGGFEAMVVIDSIGGGPAIATEQKQPTKSNAAKAPIEEIKGAPKSNQFSRPNNNPTGNYYGARHIAVNKNGDVYVKLRTPTSDGYGNAALRDLNGDGKMDSVTIWGKYENRNRGTAMQIHNGYLYFTSELMVFRNKLKDGQLVPDSKMDTVVIDTLPYHEHMAKALAFDGRGSMFVSWGMGTNSCQVDNRKPGSPGMNPCPYLVDHGGIWKFDENKLQQKQSDGTRYATGIRSIVGMSWDKGSDALYAVHHGRDDLRLLWPQYYTPWQSAMLPSDEFFKVSEGFDGGFPYYYYDQMLEKKMLSPEYGGDGKKEGDGAKLPKPLVGFPGHFAPNDILFYKGDQFPARYKEGAFISLHGSTNRIPYPQVGNVVVFVPMKNGKVTGPWEVFADGFAGKDTLAVANDATYRPMGLTEGPDGSLYVGETQKGKIWRIMYKGDKKSFGNKELAVMEKRKALPHLKTPDEMADNLDRIGKPVHAELLYNIYCRNCHQNDGNGDGSRFPPLAGSEWVNSDKTVLINVVLNGLTGAITVKGQNYNEAMPAHASFLTDKEISEILTYVRRSWGNKSGPISEKEVADVRKLMSRK
jgi:glucose/arabinose dehydrogenase